MSVTMYSSGCPKCRVLETKLKQKNVEFEISSDIDHLIELGFKSIPQLEVNGKFFSFKQACNIVGAFSGDTDFEKFASIQKAV